MEGVALDGRLLGRDGSMGRDGRFNCSLSFFLRDNGLERSLLRMVLRGRWEGVVLMGWGSAFIGSLRRFWMPRVGRWGVRVVRLASGVGWEGGDGRGKGLVSSSSKLKTGFWENTSFAVFFGDFRRCVFEFISISF